jgi:hypothetical protein
MKGFVSLLHLGSDLPPGTLLEREREGKSQVGRNPHASIQRRLPPENRPPRTGSVSAANM